MEHVSGSYGEISMGHHHHHHHPQHHHHHHHHHHTSVGDPMGLDPWPPRLPPQMAPQLPPSLAPHLMLESGPERRGDADVALRQASDSDVLADGGTEADVSVQTVEETEELKRLEGQEGRRNDLVESASPAQIQVQGSDERISQAQAQVQAQVLGSECAHRHLQGREQDLYDTELITDHVSRLVAEQALVEQGEEEGKGRNEQTPGQGEEVELRRVEGEGQGEGRSEEEEATDRGNRMDGQERKEGGVEMEAGGAMERGGEMEVGGEMEEEGGVEGEEGPDIELELVMGDAELDEAEIFVGQLAADVADVHAPDGHVAGAHWQALREDLSAPQYGAE
ncbi:unnamed protein product [Closterium sp. NIES-53]